MSMFSSAPVSWFYTLWTVMDTNSRNSIMPRQTTPFDGPTDQRAATSPSEDYSGALWDIAAMTRADAIRCLACDDWETVFWADDPIGFTQRTPATQPAPRKPVTPKRRSMKFRLDFYFSRQAHDELLEKLTASNKLYLTQTIPIEGTKATWIKVSWNEE